MTKLTAKQESFIDLMTKSAEHARRGFDLLLARPGFEKFFDALAEAGLFDPIHNSAPVPAGEPGFVRIPYWDALNYLEAVAKVSGEREDLQLADKVMTVVRTVSQAREPNQTIRDNYHTNRKFAEILGLVPPAVVTEADLGLIPGWLEGRFDRGMVGHALDRGAMRRFLASESTDDWNKACTILRHCTAILWIEERELGENRKKPVAVVEDYRLKELIQHHAKELGNRVGKKAAEIFVERLRETFDQGRRNLPSWLHRPAVEDHTQNHEWLGPENRFVEGLRDVLLSWIDRDLPSAKPFVEGLLRDEAAIIRRISLHALDQRWENLKGLFASVLGPQLFTAEHLHELYNLLLHHFATFNDKEKASTVEAIRQLPTPSEGEDQEGRLRHIQWNWLSAIAGKNYEPADTWFNARMSDQNWGGISEHPDFVSYMETWRGHGPSPYQTQELVLFAEEGSIIERLNAFQQLDSWRGPTTKALTNSLEEATALAPQTFLRLLPKFLNAKRAFQYAVIAGFKHLWLHIGEQQQPMDWNTTWPKLIQFFEELIKPPEFWTEQVIDDHDLTPNKDWVPPVIAEFIKAGTLDDQKAYSPDLLPRTWALLEILLHELEMQKEAPHSDATNQAINWPRGKAIEALFVHALRECRVSDQTHKGHVGAWAKMKQTFDSELAKCRNTNFEFSTLVGNYITNLDYMSNDWLREHIGQIFPPEFTDNFRCALDGLSYATVSDSIYELLVKKGVIDLALSEQLAAGRVRERLIERIALAYLWGHEQLDSQRFRYLFQPEHLEDIQDASGWFWSIREEQLSTEKVDRILQFLDHCISWSRTLPSPPTKLLSNLSRLTCYLQALTKKEMGWLLAVAPYVNVDYNYDFFLEELERLVDVSPAEVSLVVKAFLDSYVPDYDYEDKLKSILTKLAQHGKRNDAIAFAEKLRHLPGMIQFYSTLCESTGDNN
jgi:hypothetical protein